MREFKNGNVDEFFTKDEFDELKKEYCFKDPEAVRERIHISMLLTGQRLTVSP